MIRVQPTDEPPTFDEKCRKPGQAWLEKNPSADRPYPYWNEFDEDLRKAFHGRCAYLGLYIARGTCDHFESFKGAGGRTLAYEWSNYRYCDSRVNNAKKPAWDGRLVDPFNVDDSWFEVLLPSCEFQVHEDKIPQEPPELLANVRFTVEKLGLKEDWATRLRLEWYQLYQANELTWEALNRFAPMVARAVQPDPSAL